MAVTGVSAFERFFRLAAGLDVDKDDLKRFNEFIDHKIDDLLTAAQATATANKRDVIATWDLPLTAGLRRSIQEYKKLDQQVGLQPSLERLARYPANVTLSVEAEEELTRVVGGLSLALARTFKIIDPDVLNPSTRHWEQAFKVFDLLL
jgi:hypothetical protein